ncbi:MAG: biotin--[acetyl-CoA-carboxylase] ligase, partial [Bacilli bacterium]
MFNILSFDELDSTNNYAKNNIAILNDGDVIFAKKQTAGRGRMNRAWSSSDGNLTFTIVIKEKFLLNKFDCLSLLSASAIFNVLSSYTSNVSIKWPNDVYVNDKKICGILLEGASSAEGLSYLIIGIGVNLNKKSFDEELKDKATSLYLQTNKCYDVIQILKQILKEF